MPFQPKVRIISTSTAAIQVVDNTGLYDAISNPGGYGGPNPNKVNVASVLTSPVPLNSPLGGFVKLSQQDQDNYLYQGGVIAVPTNGIGFNDGVYSMEVLLGFNNLTPFDSDAGNFDFTMAGADVLFATAIGFTIPSISLTDFYPIDRTKPLTSTGGFVTAVLPKTITTIVVIYFEATSKALVSQAGLDCLNRDIAAFAGTCDCCAGEDLDALLVRFAEYQAMNIKFSVELDYPGADTLAKRLAAACRVMTSCSPQGTQPNVPFIGNKPIITLQPVNQSVQVGAEVVFAVAATGTAPLSYQWYKNGILLPGKTSSDLVLENAQVSDSAGFYVIVSNAFGSVQSNTVSLTVGSGLTAVTIVTQPSSVAGIVGGAANFTVVAAGSPVITYQWRKNGAPIGGATAATLALTNIQAGDVASYDCVVTNPVNSVITNAVTLSLGITAGWGWSDLPPAVLADLQAGQGSASFPSGGTITADFRANTQAKFLWMYEPVSQPAKVKWFGDVNNNGPIGDPNNDLFGATFTISGFRVYVTVFKTLQTGTPIQFLTS